MTKYRFDISHASHKTIEVEADKGLLYNSWDDLSVPSCLTVPNGGFNIEADESIFISGGNTNFRLLGKPFDANPGDTGSAVLEMSEVGCSKLDWTWKLISTT